MSTDIPGKNRSVRNGRSVRKIRMNEYCPNDGLKIGILPQKERARARFNIQSMAKSAG